MQTVYTLVQQDRFKCTLTEESLALDRVSSEVPIWLTRSRQQTFHNASQVNKHMQLWGHSASNGGLS